MQQNHEAILNIFFREAELGNWKKVEIENIAKKLNIKSGNLRKVVPHKNYFLDFYNIYVDKEVMAGISGDEIKISANYEIIQEYFMSKLEIMSKRRFGIINVLNSSIKDPSFLVINLKSNKNSINQFLTKVRKERKNISQIVLTKLLLGVWLLAFNKWLYSENDKEAGFSTINKGIKTIKDSTNLFTKI